MPINVGCLLSILYVNGMTMIMAAGGAYSDNLDSRFMKDAKRVAGR